MKTEILLNVEELEERIAPSVNGTGITKLKTAAGRSMTHLLRQAAEIEAAFETYLG